MVSPGRAEMESAQLLAGEGVVGRRQASLHDFPNVLTVSELQHALVQRNMAFDVRRRFRGRARRVVDDEGGNVQHAYAAVCARQPESEPGPLELGRWIFEERNRHRFRPEKRAARSQPIFMEQGELRVGFHRAEPVHGGFFAG